LAGLGEEIGHETDDPLLLETAQWLVQSDRAGPQAGPRSALGW
jgi:hypothetical protein